MSLALCLHVEKISCLLLRVASSSLNKMNQHSRRHSLHCFVVVLYPLAVAKIDQVNSWGIPLSLSSHMWVLRAVPFCSLWLKLPLCPLNRFLNVLMVRPVYLSTLVMGVGEGLATVGLGAGGVAVTLAL